MYTILSFLFLLGVVISLEITAPYTKVEESFNMQAAHDMLLWKERLQLYDHHEFSGVVPRTFLGGAVLGSMCSVASVVADFILGGSMRTRMFEQHAVRCTLGLLSCVSVWILGRSLPLRDARAHKMACSVLMIMVGLTYHFAFYASRTLPNTFALVLVNCSVALLFQGRVRCGFALLAASSAVFRSDVLVFIAPLSLLYILSGSVNVITGIVVGISGAFVSLLVTVPLDSLMWGRLLWPEFVVLFFNTVENKSSEWGTSPFHWYFTSAIPKGFLLLTPLAFIAPVLSSHCRKEFLSALVFVVLYSFLPHKEVRFILIVFPTLLCPAACMMGKALANCVRKPLRFRIALVVFAFICASQLAVVVAFHSLANRKNYPGAEALRRVYSIGDNKCNVAVYIDAFAGMTGISRFSKRVSTASCQWRFSKDPNLFNSTADVYNTSVGFDYLIVRSGDREWHERKGVYRWVEDVETVDGVHVRKLSVVMKPFLSIMERNA